MGFFAINNTSDNITYCAITGGIFLNLKNSYNTQINETSAFSASVVMFLLAALFFNLNFFSGLSDVSAILDPKVRVFLSSALSLFLPIMSYLFSEAKNSKTYAIELLLRARLILIWLLLVKLLRKKVEEIRYTQGITRSMLVIGALISMVLVDCLGRRFLFVEASIQMIASMVVVAVILALKFRHGKELSKGVGTGRDGRVRV